MKRPDFSKMFFFTVTASAILVGAFGVGLYSGASKNALFYFIADTRTTIRDAFDLVSQETSTMTGLHPTHFLEPARYEGAGVTINELSETGDLVFMSGFFKDTNELRLMRRDGSIVNQWPIVFSEIFPDASHAQWPPATDWNVETSGALVMPDGAVVFNFGYAGLVKLDRCGELLWTVPQPTHHSVERSEEGGYWVPSRREHKANQASPFPPYQTPFWEDTILKVSGDGQILQEISITQLFFDNNLEAQFTATGEEFKAGMTWDQEMVHNNKIAELPSDIASDFPMFDAGDLLLSLRNLNLLMVIDPDTLQVKWWQVGPWIRQHDPEFRSGGTVVVFNNNIYQTSQEMPYLEVPRVSNILELDLATDETEILYGGSKERELLSIVGAKVDTTHIGGLIITEFAGGRVVEIDSEGRVIWEYINRYDDDEVAEIIEARIYPQDYFGVADWICESN